MEKSPFPKTKTRRNKNGQLWQTFFDDEDQSNKPQTTGPQKPPRAGGAAGIVFDATSEELDTADTLPTFSGEYTKVGTLNLTEAQIETVLSAEYGDPYEDIDDEFGLRDDKPPNGGAVGHDSTSIDVEEREAMLSNRDRDASRWESVDMAEDTRTVLGKKFMIRRDSDLDLVLPTQKENWVFRHLCARWSKWPVYKNYIIAGSAFLGLVLLYAIVVLSILKGLS